MSSPANGSRQSFRPPEDFWAVTSFFNPMGYRRRLANFRTFRAHLNVPLVAIELAYGPEFELSDSDADVLIQLRGRDVLWQKERLFNAALQHVPSACRKIAWLDCDIVFERDDWAEAASNALDRLVIIQLFGDVHYMPRDWTPGNGSTCAGEFSRGSIASAAASGLQAGDCMADAAYRVYGTYAPGFAWAARRELIEAHGFYDVCIVGGGDRAIACACYDAWDLMIARHHMHDREKQRYVEWANSLGGAINSTTGFVDGNIFHLWHGEIQNRRMRERYRGLERFQFDPTEDIVIEHGGGWRWNTDKPEMHSYVQEYFATRREDG